MLPKAWLAASRVLAERMDFQIYKLLEVLSVLQNAARYWMAVNCDISVMLVDFVLRCSSRGEPILIPFQQKRLVGVPEGGRGSRAGSWMSWCERVDSVVHTLS